MKKIKVLVVDDSALMRKIISDMINSQRNMEVVATARNGKDLIDKVEVLSPDVITLDVEMPVMDGMEALKELQNKKINIPVIVLSSFSKRSSELTMECLGNGAFDFLPKPSGSISLDIDKVKDDLITKINLAHKKCEIVCSREDIKKDPRKIKLVKNTINNKKIEAVVIGASTGGPKALYEVITKLPKNLGVPIFVVQHMPPTFTKAFADRLNNNSNLKVVEAAEGEIIEENVVYIAQGGYHMEINNSKISLNKEETLWGVRPAVDKLFFSAAKTYKDKLLSIVLTGMGKDGANGTVEVKKNGGITISEDESTCTIYGMPKSTFDTGKVDMVLPIHEISDAIIKIVEGRGNGYGFRKI
ncbi:chemotaxis response regulator protein-glutamate methylesterase [Clostridium tetani]|nr:chemotaxis response regulator protein-glutamate methylesterase [Clostridium tetani]QBD87570.1 chemotaxis response regulator protein-glutamate methylesterase [Clostridium tetani]